MGSVICLRDSYCSPRIQIGGCYHGITDSLLVLRCNCESNTAMMKICRAGSATDGGSATNAFVAEFGYNNSNFSIQACRNGNGTAPLLVNPVGGNVGIGTNSPDKPLEIRRDSLADNSSNTLLKLTGQFASVRRSSTPSYVSRWQIDLDLAKFPFVLRVGRCSSALIHQPHIEMRRSQLNGHISLHMGKCVHIRAGLRP